MPTSPLTDEELDAGVPDDEGPDEGGAPSPSTDAKPPVATTPPDHSKRYGGFALQLGDRDDKVIYAGKVQTALTTGRPPSLVSPGTTTGSTLTLPEYVAQLQKDLRQLGILWLAGPTGIFDLQTVWSVREFQIHSKMDSIALEDVTKTTGLYIDRLSTAGNSQKYSGPVSGVVNQDTADRIDLWLKNNWRCPVVMLATKMVTTVTSTTVGKGKKKKVIKKKTVTRQITRENIWDGDDLTAGTVFARDFSGYYSFPSTQDPNGRIPVGYHTSSLDGGPVSTERAGNVWPEAKVTPENLVGSPFTALSTAAQSTFKVIRAWCELECGGFYDSINAYDNCVISLGLCHWTFEIRSGARTGNGPVSVGELGGFVSLFESKSPGDSDRLLGGFGLHAEKPWSSGLGPWSSASRKFISWWNIDTEAGPKALPLSYLAGVHDGTWFKSWHWVYRAQMAARTEQSFRDAMWDMARLRIRGVLSAPWGAGVAKVGAGAAARPATIGDVITSERGVAVICRAHVWRPAWVVYKTAGRNMRATLAAAIAAAPTLNWTTDPSTWTDAHESALVDAMKTSFTNSLTPAWQHMKSWPGALASDYPAHTILNVTRNSFSLDQTGLPPPLP